MTRPVCPMCGLRTGRRYLIRESCQCVPLPSHSVTTWWNTLYMGRTPKSAAVVIAVCVVAFVLAYLIH
jgi:hypothetical protein